MTLFETETMAELCVKQGLMSDAVQIYRRLVAQAPDELTLARRQRRLGELEAALGPRAPAPGHQALAEPGLRVGWRAGELVIEWRLAGDTRAPAIQLLLVRHTAGGVETEAVTLRLGGASGSTTLAASGLHSLRAAAGWLDGDRFVPVVRVAERIA
jgi:hypothetical protein